MELLEGEGLIFDLCPQYLKHCKLWAFKKCYLANIPTYSYYKERGTWENESSVPVSVRVQSEKLKPLWVFQLESIEESRLTQPSEGPRKGRIAGAFGASENIGILRGNRGVLKWLSCPRWVFSGGPLQTLRICLQLSLRKIGSSFFKLRTFHGEWGSSHWPNLTWRHVERELLGNEVLGFPLRHRSGAGGRRICITMKSTDHPAALTPSHILIENKIKTKANSNCSTAVFKLYQGKDHSRKKYLILS